MERSRHDGADAWRSTAFCLLLSWLRLDDRRRRRLDLSAGLRAGAGPWSPARVRPVRARSCRRMDCGGDSSATRSTAFAIWAPIAAHVPSALDVRHRVVRRSRRWRGSCAGGSLRPLCRAARGHRRGSTALLVVLVLTLAVATPPFAHVGRTDERGQSLLSRLLHRRLRLAHRAHVRDRQVLDAAAQSVPGATANSLLLDLLPPARGGLAGRSRAGPRRSALFEDQRADDRPAADVGRVPRRRGRSRRVRSAVGDRRGRWRSSRRAPKGSIETLQLWSRGAPLAELRNWNIDAVTAWPPFAGHRIDGLQRCLWYVPQHSMAYALGIVALVGRRRQLAPLRPSSHHSLRHRAWMFGRVQPAGRRHLCARVRRVDRRSPHGDSRAVVAPSRGCGRSRRAGARLVRVQSDGRRRRRFPSIRFSWRLAAAADRDAVSVARSDSRDRSRRTDARADGCRSRTALPFAILVA